jgi:sulfide:quinone oxidoreductase
MSRVLVLGGGFGGIAAATRLRSRLDPTYEVVLIDRRRDFVMGLRKTWAIIGSHRMGEGARPLATLRERGIDVREGTIEAIDPVGRRARVDGEWLTADALVIALGADQAPEAIPGLAEYGINVWDRALAMRGHDALTAMRSGRLVIGIFGLPYACPPGPFELALLAMEDLERRGADATVEVFGPMPIALPVVGPVESAKLEGIVEAAGIPFHRGHTAVEVDARTVRFADGKTLAYDVLFGIPPHHCPQVLVDAGLAASGGWVTVDRATLETSFPHVYAVGDCTVIKLANGLSLPKAGVFAEAEGYVAADRIADETAGRAGAATFVGEGTCYAEVGGGRAAAVRGRFLAEPPFIGIAEPSSENLAAKVAFESNRLADWFGA